MSQKVSNLFWEVADTKLITQILRAENSELAQQLAKKAGYDVTTAELGKNVPKMLVTRALNKPKLSVVSSASSKEASSKEASSNASSSNASSSYSPNSPKAGPGVFVYYNRPVV